VDTLVCHYVGSVELAETGADGTTFVVELPVASGDTGRTAADNATEDDIRANQQMDA